MAENIPKRPARKTALPADGGPPAPAHLTNEAAGMWREIVGEWELGPDSLPLLRAALESWDLYQTARADVVTRGPTITNPDTGLVRQHPSIKTANDALTQFRQCFRQLGLQPPE